MCYQQKVLTSINVMSFIAIVLAGTIATQWSDLQKIMNRLTNFLSLKLVKMKVLNINLDKLESKQNIVSAYLDSFSCRKSRGSCLA